MDENLFRSIVSDYIVNNNYTFDKIIHNELLPLDGDNFTSIIYLVSFQVKDENGKVCTKHAIAKEASGKLEKIGSRVYAKEIKVYKEVLGVMQDFITSESDLGLIIPWAQCIGTSESNTIVLEDLKESGYKMADRRKGLDWSHCKVVINAIARFHAVSAYLIHKGKLRNDLFGRMFFVAYSEIIKTIFNSNLSSVIETMDEWPSEWGDIRKKLEGLLANGLRRLDAMYDIDERNFNVMCHGDCWVNNLMFSYDKNDEPTSIKFVDFQLTHYNSYTADLHYFIASSPTDDIRLNKYNDIIKLYHDDIRGHFEQLEWTPKNLPSLDQMKKDMAKTQLFEVSTALIVLPIVKAPLGSAPIVGEPHEDPEQQRRKYIRIRDPAYVKALQIVFKRANQTGTLDPK